MMALYLFAVLLGGGLLAFSIFGGDADADVDLDMDAGHGGDALKWLSLRTASYFLFVFGGVGAALTATWHVVTAPLIALIAAASGVGVATLVSATFRYLKRTDSGDRTGNEQLVGLSGRITVPFGASGMGKVLVSSASRSLELMARPFGTSHGDPATWTAIIVVEMDRGVALVAPLDPPALANPDAPSHS
jgi:hypothetical protein